jgi:signal transduction histidine kinase
MRLAKERKGQFIIIAAMLLAIMIISVSTVIYGTVTYYRQERWEEYVTIVDSIKTASCNILQVGLANYAQTLEDLAITKERSRIAQELHDTLSQLCLLDEHPGK